MLLNKLLSRIPPVNLYPSKNKKKEKAKFSYIHVSTKVVTYKDEASVVREAIVGITYVKAKE